MNDFDLAQGLMVAGLAIVVFGGLALLLQRLADNLGSWRQPDDHDGGPR